MLVAWVASITETSPRFAEDTVEADPLKQFAAWFKDAVAAGEILPEAMTIATSTRSGEPSARMVLLRGFDDRGFGFFTNYDSQKGRELAENARAALVVYWAKLGRQVRVSGDVVKQTVEESTAYFQRRPLASQISALASPQSQVIRGRASLEDTVSELTKKYEGGVVPLPENWGGYRVIPRTIEFWLHRDNRLHDRIRYTRQAQGGWRLDRLAP
ncbi:MAG TPA: pyridoxamine 5'-phosphate oxidase, partial [Candidatus Acidoferrum sp.]|nr:pyridoxamine 5'-phosphate oxidase [Candidatus Acidoferrum sp.]